VAALAEVKSLIMNSFFFLDAARCGFENIEKAKSLTSSAHAIAFPLMEKESYLEEVAPYLFAQEKGLVEWYVQNGWYDSWGYFFESDATFERCLTHFQRMAIKREAGKAGRYFRFYDPRVLKKILPGYEQQQVIDFFGPVGKFIVEGDVYDESIEFSQKNGTLTQKKVTANLLINENSSKVLIS